MHKATFCLKVGKKPDGNKRNISESFCFVRFFHDRKTSAVLFIGKNIMKGNRDQVTDDVTDNDDNHPSDPAQTNFLFLTHFFPLITIGHSLPGIGFPENITDELFHCILRTRHHGAAVILIEAAVMPMQHPLTGLLTVLTKIRPETGFVFLPVHHNEHCGSILKQHWTGRISRTDRSHGTDCCEPPARQ